MWSVPTRDNLHLSRPTMTDLTNPEMGEIARIPTVRIPTMAGSDSDGRRAPVPMQGGHFGRRHFRAV